MMARAMFAPRSLAAAAGGGGEGGDPGGGGGGALDDKFMQVLPQVLHFPVGPAQLLGQHPDDGGRDGADQASHGDQDGEEPVRERGGAGGRRRTLLRGRCCCAVATREPLEDTKAALPEAGRRGRARSPGRAGR